MILGIRLNIIGIIGRMGSGKSTVMNSIVKLLPELSVKKLNVDHLLYSLFSNPSGEHFNSICSIVQRVYNNVQYDFQGRIDYRWLEQMFYRFPELQEIFRETISPYVRSDFSNWLKVYLKDYNLVLVEGIALVHSACLDLVQWNVIWINTPLDLCYLRVQKRDRCGDKRAIERVNRHIDGPSLRMICEKAKSFKHYCEIDGRDVNSISNAALLRSFICYET